MKLIDPHRFLGVDSGTRELRVSAQERSVLLRAAAILERGHDLFIEAAGEDHQGDYEDAGDALCTGPVAIRRLADEGLVVA